MCYVCSVWLGEGPTGKRDKKGEMEIISFCQRKRFPDEFNCLQRGGRVKRTSHIYKLNPVLENCVLRVGGQLSRSAMPEECKHPTILAKDLHISEVP